MSEFTPGPITWEECAALSSDYEDVLTTEETGHNLYVDKHDTIRWEANPAKEQEIMNKFGAHDLNDLFGCCRADKNDPLVRELYKNMGVSLYMFWEVFYWEVNNERADEYCSRQMVKKMIERKKVYGYNPLPAKNFMKTVAANVDNDKLTDEEFREFIRNTLPIVDY